MSNEENTIKDSHFVEEDQGIDSVVENCSAKCPTCQQPCAYTAGHGGLHHCEKGHEWV